MIYRIWVSFQDYQEQQVLFRQKTKMDLKIADFQPLKHIVEQDIILEQKEILNRSNTKEDTAVTQNIEKLLTKIDGISDTISEHDENSSKIKEDLVNTIVSVFSSSNFVEETEDIKDFVEEKRRRERSLRLNPYLHR